MVLSPSLEEQKQQPPRTWGMNLTGSTIPSSQAPGQPVSDYLGPINGCREILTVGSTTP